MFLLSILLSIYIIVIMVYILVTTCNGSCLLDILSKTYLFLSTEGLSRGHTEGHRNAL